MHWTYTDAWAADDDLEQGDLLAPTAELRRVLNDVHPHFCDDKYLAFCVATQSCDLVRHGKKPPKARYVTIATVRSLKQVMPKLLATVAKPVVPGVFRASAREKAQQLIERLLDQNEQALGLFYLHPDAEVGLGESAVAFLRVTVALRGEHYAVLTDARCGRLHAEFRAKFGWLIGNLYSRAAAPDWADAPGGREEVKRLIRSNTREHLPGRGPIWVDDDLVDAAEGKLTFEDVDRPTLLRELEKHRPVPRLDQLADEVLARLRGMQNPAEDPRPRIRQLLPEQGAESHLDRLVEHLQTKGVDDAETEAIVAELRRAIPNDDFRGLVEDLVGSPGPSDDEFQRKLRGRLMNSGRLKKLVKR